MLLTAEEGLELSRWEGVSLMGVLEGYMRYSLKRAKRLPGVSQAQRVLALQDPAIEARMTESYEKIRAHDPAVAEAENRPRSITPTLRWLSRSYCPHCAPRSISAASPTCLARRPADPKQSDESFVQEMLRMSAGYLAIEER